MVAGELIFQTGLCATFVVPTKTLVVQTQSLLDILLSGVPIGIYYGEEKRPVGNGVNITTYATLQRHFATGCLPAAIRRAALVFVDEAHHAMTKLRMEVLIEGWNAPRCKLLVDLAPSLSIVRATQKYFRVMTRHKAMEARIVVLLPKDLPRAPVLPIDLLLKPGQAYHCGDFINCRHRAKSAKRAAIDGPSKTPVTSVRLKSRLIACATLAKPSLDPNDDDQIRQVLESCPDFSPSLPFGRMGFGRLFFDHPHFFGPGELLLRYLGIADGREPYFEFIAKLYPRQLGNRFIERHRRVFCTVERPCIEDFIHLAQTAAESNCNGGRPDDALFQALHTLCGGVMMTADPEALLLQLEQAESVLNLLAFLDKRSRRVVVKRLGLFGERESTLREIATEIKVSVERVRTIYLKAIHLLQKKHRIRTRFDRPMAMTCRQYPDLAPIICQFGGPDAGCR